MIIIVTSDGDKVLTPGETGVLRIPFHQFVKESKTLLGVKLRHTEVQRFPISSRESFSGTRV